MDTDNLQSLWGDSHESSFGYCLSVAPGFGGGATRAPQRADGGWLPGVGGVHPAKKTAFSITQKNIKKESERVDFAAILW